MFKIIKEFKEFAVKGNMIDIAIGVIIGASFGKVVDVLVKEIFMPPLAFLTDGFSWSNKKIILREAVNGGGVTVDEIAIGYGKLVEVAVDFLIVSISVFIVVKLMNSLKRKAQDVNDTTVHTPKDIELLDKMANLLEKQNIMLEEQMKK